MGGSGCEQRACTSGEGTVCTRVEAEASTAWSGTGKTGLPGEEGSHRGSWLEQHLTLVTAVRIAP